MKQYRRLAIGVASLGLVLAAAAAIAHEGGKDAGMQGGMHGRMQEMHGKMEGMHDQMGEKHGRMGGRHEGGGDREAIRGLMTPEERTAVREKMQAAKTPEERQAIAAANRAEIEKRAKAKGITLPERQAGMGGMGSRGEHKH